MQDESGKINPEGTIFERRRFVRIGGNFVVSYVDISTQERKSDITQTKNISVGGILFTTDRQFPGGTILKLRLRLPEAPDYINVKVKVVSSRQMVKGMLYETRVRFIGIKQKDRNYIKKMIECCLQEQKKG